MKTFFRLFDSKFVTIAFISAIYGTIFINLIGLFILFTDDDRDPITAPILNPEEEFIKYPQDAFKKSYHGNLAAFGLFYIDVFGDNNNSKINLVIPTKAKRETMCQSYFLQKFWPGIFNIYTYPAHLKYDDQYECTLSSKKFDEFSKNEIFVKEYINTQQYYQNLIHPITTLFYIDKNIDSTTTYYFYEYVENDKEHIFLLTKSYSLEN